MKTPYLIQRMKLRNIANGKGFDGRFELDYMGSAEFEFGSLPNSLKRICSGWNNISILQTDPVVKAADGMVLFIMCNRDTLFQYRKEFVPKLVDGSIRLKEWSGIPESLERNLTKPSWQITEKFNAWWDIDNDVFLLLGNKTVDAMKLAIPEVIEKKRAKGETDWLPEGKA